MEMSNNRTWLNKITVCYHLGTNKLMYFLVGGNTLNRTLQEWPIRSGRGHHLEAPDMRNQWQFEEKCGLFHSVKASV